MPGVRLFRERVLIQGYRECADCGKAIPPLITLCRSERVRRPNRGKSREGKSESERGRVGSEPFLSGKNVAGPRFLGAAEPAFELAAADPEDVAKAFVKDMLRVALCRRKEFGRSKYGEWVVILAEVRLPCLVAFHLVGIGISLGVVENRATGYMSVELDRQVLEVFDGTVWEFFVSCEVVRSSGVGVVEFAAPGGRKTADPPTPRPPPAGWRPLAVRTEHQKVKFADRRHALISTVEAERNGVTTARWVEVS